MSIGWRIEVEARQPSSGLWEEAEQWAIPGRRVVAEISLVAAVDARSHLFSQTLEISISPRDEDVFQSASLSPDQEFLPVSA